jgi:DNA mismatch repair protein MutS
MDFHSILFERIEDGLKKETLEAPPFFGDLHLDQIIEAITIGREEYDLKPFFYTSLPDSGAIKYRHQIMQDLENEILFGQIKSFAAQMQVMREHLVKAEKLYYKCQKESWFLDAVLIYGAALNSLADDLSRVELQSRGLTSFREYVKDYVKSSGFTSLLTEAKDLKNGLAAVKYCLLIKGNSIKVRHYQAEIDHSAEVEETFAKFKQGAAKDYRVEFHDYPEMNHVEAGIVDLVAQLYPDLFAQLDDYYAKNGNYQDKTITVFDREVQFYLAYLDHIALFKRAGLQFCYPQISSHRKEVYDYEGFDLALAFRLVHQSTPVVCNDFYLKDPERILVVSGPNQGGKTTFARAFGQLHYLAGLGCPIPGREAQLFLYDRLFTHFEKEEDFKNLHGKLQDDLIRIYDILERATSNSLIIMNEIFSSTTLKDAVYLGKKIMARINQLDLLCVCVTFIDELASFSGKTVSLVSTIVPENPALRTYKIIRKPADGLSYAISIAEKYRLTYDCLKERLN